MSDRQYWRRQTKDQLLFPDLAWSRPEHRSAAGKLLIMGGNAHGFSAPATAYAEGVAAGIGAASVLLPDSLQKTVGTNLETAEFAGSTPSGSFSRQAVAEALDLAEWADAVLLAGDLGRNSETAITIETLVETFAGKLTLTKDAIDYGYSFAARLLERENTMLVLSIAQLQRLSREVAYPSAVTFGMDLLQLAGWLHEFTLQYPCLVITKHLDTIFVAFTGLVSTTKQSPDEQIWRVKIAAHATVWWLQQPSKPFEAVTTSVVY